MHYLEQARARVCTKYVQVGAGKDPTVEGPWRHSREAVGKIAEEGAGTSPQSRGTLCQLKLASDKSRGACRPFLQGQQDYIVH